MRIWLVRHGETPGNATRVIQLPETPLSERGIAQAERLGERLSGQSVAHIVSSDLLRARMTADAVVAATGAPLSLDPCLQERNFGDLRGTPYAELVGDPFAPDYLPPAGESWEVFHARVDAAWERVGAVAMRNEGHLAVITHGFVCYSLALRHLILPSSVEVGWGFGNTAVTIVEEHSPGRVRLFNCTAHLAGEADSLSGL